MLAGPSLCAPAPFATHRTAAVALDANAGTGGRRTFALLLLLMLSLTARRCLLSHGGCCINNECVFKHMRKMEKNERLLKQLSE